MQKSFYVPDDKEELLEKIQDLTDERSLSSAIIEALEYYIENNRNISDEERQLRRLERRLREEDSELKRLKNKRADLEKGIEGRRKVVETLREKFRTTKKEVEAKEEKKVGVTGES